jgi:Tfp pilus assembly protein PilV
LNKPLHRSGFTLVETALALFAISLGLLGIFGLARHGLKAGGDVENETRCALLADTVFETLKAKNNELAAEKYTLARWQFFWLTFENNAALACFLPQMPDVSSQDTALRVWYGTHNLQDRTAVLTPSTEPDKWNPQYTLTFGDAGSDSQFDVTLSIHPGALQSGAETRTYSTVLYYSGGLP